MGSVRISFRPRDIPLPALAALALGETSVALAERLLQESNEALALLRGAAGDSALLVMGSQDHLPWVDGIVYLGIDPLARSLLLPTNLAPNVPASVLERATLASLQQGTRSPAWIAVHPSPPRLVSFLDPYPIERGRLRGWLEANPKDRS